MTVPSASLLVALACVAACGTARADRSMLLDPGEVVEAGDCELEIAFERQTARDAPPEREAAVQLECGIGWRTDLVASVARRRGDDFRGQGFSLEGKTALGVWGIAGLGWSLEYGVAAERSTDAGWRRSEQFLALTATFHPDAAWAIEFRLGTAREREARRDKTLWSLTVEHEFHDAVEAKLEWGGDDRSRPLLGVELRWEFWPDRARLNLFYGGVAGSERERLVGVGLTFEF